MDVENVNWGNCILCQEDTGEVLKQSSTNKNKNEIKNTYDGVETVLKDYHDANILPETFHPILPRLISLGNLSTLFQENEAKWHHSCKSKVTNSKFQRSTQKRKPDEIEAPIVVKRTRSKTIKFDKNTCFIPGCKAETTEKEPLHDVMSKELDARFREYASFMDDKELLTKLAGGDLIALEAKYHSTCGTMYYNRVKAKIREERSTFRSIQKLRYNALLDLVNDLEEFRYDMEAPVFLLSDLVRKYNKKLVEILPPELGSPPKTHSTRLKDDILAEIPDLQYHRKGKQGYFVFN